MHPSSREYLDGEENLPLYYGKDCLNSSVDPTGFLLIGKSAYQQDSALKLNSINRGFIAAAFMGLSL